MILKGRKKGTVRFSIRPAQDARQAYLAGEFSEWNPIRMRKRAGEFSVSIAVEPGTYQYKYVIDDQWVPDPDNSNWAISDCNTVNSVAIID